MNIAVKYSTPSTAVKMAVIRIFLFFMFLTDVWSAGGRWGRRAETAQAVTSRLRFVLE